VLLGRWGRLVIGSAHQPARAVPHFALGGRQRDAAPLWGTTTGPAAEWRFGYRGENRFIDRLAPTRRRSCGCGMRVPPRHIPCASPMRSRITALLAVQSSLAVWRTAAAPPPRTAGARDRAVLRSVCAADTFPPVIVHDPIQEFEPAGVPIPILADIQDPSGIAAVELEYRSGDGAVRTALMTRSNGLYQGSLPGAASGEWCNTGSARLTHRQTAARH